MAVVKNLMVRAGADFSAITKQANKVNQSLSGMQATFDKVGASLKKAFSIAGLAAAGKAIYDAGKAAKESYDQQAEAQAKLAQVMRNTMGASGKEVAEIQALADAQQKLGVISADTQIAAAQELATYLQMPSSLKTLMPVLNDMAAQQFGLNATAEQTTTIATMLGKVMEGQTGALSRYGYSFTEAQEAILKYGDEAERAAVLSDVVSQSVGGMNAALPRQPGQPRRSGLCQRLRRQSYHAGRGLCCCCSRCRIRRRCRHGQAGRSDEEGGIRGEGSAEHRQL